MHEGGAGAVVRNYCDVASQSEPGEHGGDHKQPIYGRRSGPVEEPTRGSKITTEDGVEEPTRGSKITTIGGVEEPTTRSKITTADGVEEPTGKSKITTQADKGQHGVREHGYGSEDRRAPRFEKVYVPNTVTGRENVAYPETLYLPNEIMATREGFPAWRFGNTDLPVPEFEALFRVRPRGPDRWDSTYVDKGWLIRVHGKERKRYFHPVHRNCPYAVGAFHGNRVTVRFVEASVCFR